MSQKKFRVGPKKVGSVGLPEMRHYFFLGLKDSLIMVYVVRHSFLHLLNALLHGKITIFIFEPPHEKTNKMTCVPSEDSGNPPSLIRVFAVRSVGS